MTLINVGALLSFFGLLSIAYFTGQLSLLLLALGVLGWTLWYNHKHTPGA